MLVICGLSRPALYAGLWLGRPGAWKILAFMFRSSLQGLEGFHLLAILVCSFIIWFGASAGILAYRNSWRTTSARSFRTAIRNFLLQQRRDLATNTHQPCQNRMPGPEWCFDGSPTVSRQRRPLIRV